jgi:CAP-Gly domain
MSSHAGGWAPGSLPPPGPVAQKAKSSLRVGQRARKLGTANQTGVIRYVGDLDGRPGVWVGVEWDELGLGDTTGELNGRRYFVCSHRGQKVGNAASFVRESELFVSGACVSSAAPAGGRPVSRLSSLFPRLPIPPTEHMARSEDTPLVVRPGEDVYDWSVRPRGASLTGSAV